MTNLIELVQEKAPAVLEGTLRLVGVRLLGALIEWPEAAIKERTQIIRDRTAARSAATLELSKHMSEHWKSDAARVAALTEFLVEDVFPSALNRASVFRKAVDNLSQQSGTAAPAAGKPPSEDWLNTFARLSGEASSEDVQDAFARILAGEITTPGTYSRAALRVVSELTSETARAFAGYVERSFDGYVRFDALDAPTMILLRDAGLVHAAELTFAPNVIGEQRSDFELSLCSGTLTLKWHDPRAFKISPSVAVSVLTSMGRQVSNLLPKPDEVRNLRDLALSITNQPELVYAALNEHTDSKEIIVERSYSEPVYPIQA